MSGSHTWTNISSSTAAVTNRFVTSTNMKVGAYTLANTTASHGAGFRVTCAITAVTGNDTAGTLVLVGTNLAGQAVTETLTLVDGTGANGTQIFKSLTSITGAGWVINTGNDTLIVGQAAGAYIIGTSGNLEAVVVNGTAASAFSIADSRGTIATFKASIAEGTYEFPELSVSGFLKLSTTSTNDITIVHSPTQPDYPTG